MPWKLDPAMARSILGGKKTADLKFRTTDEVKFEVMKRAAALGMNTSEWLERGLLVLLYGAAHVNSIEAERTAAVVEMVLSADTKVERAEP